MKKNIDIWVSSKEHFLSFEEEYGVLLMFYNMAAGTDFPSHFNLIEGPYNKDSNPAVKDNPLEDSNDLKQTSKGKPPRHLSIVRHSINSAILLSPSNLVSTFSFT